MQTVAVFIPKIEKKMGVYRYCFEMVKHCLPLGRDISIVLLHYPHNPLVDDLRKESVSADKFIEIKSLFGFRKILKERNVAIIHFLTPDFQSLRLSLATPRKVQKMVTIHDFLSVRKGMTFGNWRLRSKSGIRKFLLARQLGSFARIITISKSTAGAIEKKFPKIRDIAVIHEGVSRQFAPEPHSDYGNQYGKYLLCCAPHEKGLLPLFRDILKTERDLNFVIFGRDESLKKEICASADLLGIRERMFFEINISDKALVGLYQNAQAFIRYADDEGFGLPVVEAMACGCPVLVSDRGSLPEVVNIPDLIIPFEDGNAWLFRILRLVQDSAFRKLAVEKVKKRANDFRWERAAKEMVGLYKTLTENRAVPENRR